MIAFVHFTAQSAYPQRQDEKSRTEQQKRACNDKSHDYLRDENRSESRTHVRHSSTGIPAISAGRIFLYGHAFFSRYEHLHSIRSELPTSIVASVSELCEQPRLHKRCAGTGFVSPHRVIHKEKQ